MAKTVVRLNERRAWKLVGLCLWYLARRYWRKKRGKVLAWTAGGFLSLLTAIPPLLWSEMVAVKNWLQGSQVVQTHDRQSTYTPGP